MDKVCKTHEEKYLFIKYLLPHIDKLTILEGICNVPDKFGFKDTQEARDIIKEVETDNKRVVLPSH